MDEATLLRELAYKAVRSSGAGGQHVNKVATKVLLTFDLENSRAFTAAEKEQLSRKLAKKLNKEQQLQLHSDTARSQHRNRELVTRRFLKLVNDALKVPRKRKKTAPTKAAIRKRLEVKKKVAEKKAGRKRPPLDP